ncbi:helix-turn-helix domain-containing protein [Allokutzneria sp. A3M-2-11 16]|uniref:helix-turn-helix domain-containing protein n=1 Tax=Allokutzneria sp. A3M-2-11 16 TaxID=2962043 RepID=UPI0020B6F452|nr:helix-turn-helix domain-containing protein [Allokutzneria sp. A3M-2-11 16]MCP3805401.1 helix-turn-helix domain-containing protein [Allokutzneria sp. A3M-2-11 16]
MSVDPVEAGSSSTGPPPVELEPMRAHEWRELIGRAELAWQTKFVGLAMAHYANADGTRARPGLPLLAADTGLSMRTVGTYVRGLAGLGLLQLTRRGGGHGGELVANTYRLTMPLDLVDHVAVRPPDPPMPRRYRSATQVADQNGLRGARTLRWRGILLRTNLASALKFTALALSCYADGDGTRIWPGTEILAADTTFCQRTIGTHLRALATLGLIECVRRGGGRGGADQHAEYRLTLPENLLDVVELRDPDAHRKPLPRNDNTPSPVPAVSPVDNPVPPATQVAGHCGQSPVDNLPADMPAEESTGSSGPIDRQPGLPPTSHDRPQEQFPYVPAELPTARTSDEGQPNPSRCAHRLSAQVRLDGAPRCPLCRRAGHPIPPPNLHPPPATGLTALLAAVP